MTESSLTSLSTGDADDLVDVRVVLQLPEHEVSHVGTADRCKCAAATGQMFVVSVLLSEVKTGDVESL